MIFEFLYSRPVFRILFGLITGVIRPHSGLTFDLSDVVEALFVAVNRMVSALQLARNPQKESDQWSIQSAKKHSRQSCMLCVRGAERGDDDDYSHISAEIERNASEIAQTESCNSQTLDRVRFSCMISVCWKANIPAFQQRKSAIRIST